MKRLIILIVLFLIIGLGFSVQIYAQDPCISRDDCIDRGGTPEAVCGPARFLCTGLLGPTSIPNPTGLTNIGQLITKASGITTPLAVVGFIFSVIYAGFVRMTAAGNPEKEAKSMKIAIAAAIGFIIIALAPLFVKVLGSFLEVDQDLIQ